MLYDLRRVLVQYLRPFLIVPRLSSLFYRCADLRPLVHPEVRHIATVRPIYLIPVHSSASTQDPTDAMDPESSDSDVSVTGEDRNRKGSPLAALAQLPSPQPRHLLESPENVQTRLRALSQVKDHNIGKQEMLIARRRHEDDKSARKREIQNRRIKAIMDARERRDVRINTRRTGEDAAFQAVEDRMEEEKTVGGSVHSLIYAKYLAESASPAKAPEAWSTS